MKILQPYAPATKSLRINWAARDLYFVAGLVLAVAVAYLPTYLHLITGPWRTEIDDDGPLIILAVIWLSWQSRDKVKTAPVEPLPLLGWTVLLGGLATMIIARSQGVLLIEVASEIPVICGCILLCAGWPALRVLLFPIGFLAFSVPPPGWMIDTFTVPLKIMVADRVVDLLYNLGYPVAQNGVIIMIRSYELMVKDACSGMNSIFALSAIGVFYIYAFVRNAPVRAALLIMSIVPIAIAANFVRVLALVLIAYYWGVDAVEGFFHDATGFALFVIALMMFFFLDMFLLAGASGMKKIIGTGQNAKRRDPRPQEGSIAKTTQQNSSF